MFSKKPLKTFLFPAANIIVGLLLISCFTFIISHILQSVRMARFVGLETLKPTPTNYLWETNMRGAAIDKNLIRYWADYYENLLQVFPEFADAYGILGYCYHYLGNDLKAESLFKKAIDGKPDYFWYSYDLAILYIKDRHYHESQALLQKAIQLDPQASLKGLVSSAILYRLLPPGTSLQDIAMHIGQAYKQSFFLLKVFNPTLTQGKADDIMKQLKLELYVF